MNILFLLLSFPDLSKSATIYSDLVEEFASKGHNIYVVAPTQIGGSTSLSKESGINVLRVNTLSLFSGNVVVKGLANLFLPFQYEKAISRFLGDIHFELIILPTPPITLAGLVGKLKSRFKCKAYLILRDIFPQNAVDLGMMHKNGFLELYFRRKEKQLYGVVDHIGCMSQANIDYVVKHNPEVSLEKLHILMNFQKSTSIPEINISIKEKYGLKDKYVAVFGGNMGVPQKVENIVSLAKELQMYGDVAFLLIGKGTQIERIQRIALAEGVHNIVFKTFIPRTDYLQLISQCDVGLISLNEKFTIPNIPSKVLSYFDVAIPVLASIDSATDFGQLLNESDSGFYSVAGDINSFRINFEKLMGNAELRKKMGSNGKAYLEKYLTPEVAYKIILNHVS